MTEIASLIAALPFLLPLPVQPQAAEDSPPALPPAGQVGQAWPTLAWPRAEAKDEAFLPELQVSRTAVVQTPVPLVSRILRAQAEDSDLIDSMPPFLAEGSPDLTSQRVSPISEEPTQKIDKIELLNGLTHEDGSQGFPMPSLAEMAASEGLQTEFLDKDIINEGPFFRGRTFLETNVGAYVSQPGIGPRTPTFNFAPVNLRLGMVLYDPCLPGFLRGTFEALVELSTAPVVEGFGHIIFGPSALLRYNWVQPNSRLVPYLQGGMGFVYNDAYENRYQRAIGQSVEFSLKAIAGCHYLVNDRISLEIEGGLNHISNADLAGRNLGINAVGGSVGITFYFPCGRP